MQTRAAVAHKAGEPLSIETVELDGPREGEVLVEMKATGICHTDEFTLSGADPEGIFPAILGHEGAGVVVDVGKNVTSVGRRRLCFALLDEYKVYIKALSIAINLSEQERWSSLQLSQQNCPDLPWLFETAPKILAAHNLENESTKD